MLRGSLAGMVLLIGAGLGSAQDQDLVRLGGATVHADTIRLGGPLADDADTELVYRRGWGGYGYRGPGYGYGYGRGYGYGYGRGYGYGYGRGYGYGYGRGYYGRPYYGWGGYRPYYSSFYARPYSYWPYSYYNFGYGPYYYYGYPSYYYFIDPCIGEDRLMPEATRLGTSLDDVVTERLAPPAKTAPAPGTYRYDGGPRVVVPMPSGESAPTTAPPSPALPRDFRLVSIPAAKTTPAYAAYGEKR